MLGPSFLDELPERLIGDKAYDSDRLDAQLKAGHDVEPSRPTSAVGSAARRMGDRCGATQTLGSRTAFRVAPQPSPPGHPLGTPRRELSRLCTTRLPQDTAEVFMRPPLVRAMTNDHENDRGDRYRCHNLMQVSKQRLHTIYFTR